MEDGTIYAGISPSTGEFMYTTPEDAPYIYTFRDAKKYAFELAAHGHKDWRVPTIDELNVMFNNRAAIGHFEESGSYPRGWYSSSTECNGDVLGQHFSDGCTDQRAYYGVSSLRCVRG
jgi:hypothetical protein